MRRTLPVEPTGRGWIAAAWLSAALLVIAGCAERTVTDPPAPAQPPQERTIDPPAPERGPPPDATPLMRPSDAAPDEALEPVEEAERAPRVALLAPLSGRHEAIGRGVLNAAQMALFDFADEQFELLPFDTAGADGAHGAARAALEAGARLILGPVFATDVAEVAPLARERGVSVVAFSNDRSVAEPDVFVLGLMPGEQVERVVAFASEHGIRRFAALVPDSRFGRQIQQDYERAIAARGGALARVESYDSSDEALTRAARALAPGVIAARRDNPDRTPRDPGYDAVILPETGNRLTSAAAQLAFFGVETPRVRLLGLSQWADLELHREPIFHGAWFAAPPRENRAEFARRYRAAYGGDPPPLATLGYDAAALAAVLGRAEGGPAYDAETLTDARGFAGASGLFRFLPDGRSQRGLTVYEVVRDGVRAVSPAPDRFAPVTH